MADICIVYLDMADRWAFLYHLLSAAGFMAL